MAKCTFSIPFTGTPEQVLSKAKSAIETQGGQFSSNGQGGTFSISVLGTISGSFAISGQSLNVAIEKKPMLIGCGVIESTLRDQLSEL